MALHVPLRTLQKVPALSLRVVLTVVVFLTLAAGLVGGVWYFAVGVGASAPSTVRIGGLAAPVRLAWMDGEAVEIDARNATDAYTAVGFAQAVRSPWLLVLLRDTATGRLSEVFGEAYQPLDRFTRTLQFEAIARAAYDRLDAPDRDRLAAYVHGVNAALSESSVRLTPEFVLLDLPRPEAWVPWHVLAIERLYAWLAAPVHALSSPDADTPTSVLSLLEQDRMLRSWLHLFGFDLSVAGASMDEDGTSVFVQYVGGASSLPFLHEMTITGLGPDPVQAAALPGTPFFPAGATPSHAWAILPETPVSIAPILPSDSTRGTIHERIRAASGNEILVSYATVDTAGARVPIGVPDAEPDRFLQWTGFDPMSDGPAWHRLLTGDPPGFRVLTGSGVLVRPGEPPEVLGRPPVVHTTENQLMIGHAARVNLLAERLAVLARTPSVPAGDRLDDCYSGWAASLAPSLVAALPPAADMPLEQREALTYLRNWDYYYGPSSIGASIFTELVVAAGLNGSFPRDAGVPASEMLHRAWIGAVDSLRTSFGPDPEQWRWEVVHPTRLYFPVWSGPILDPAANGASTSRYAPVEFPGRGDLTTLCRGAVPAEYGLQAVLSWEGRLTPERPPRVSFRRYGIDVTPFLGRSLATEPADVTHLFPPVNAPVSITHLVPATRSLD